MRTLHRYITSSLLFTTVMAVMVLTIILLVGSAFRFILRFSGRLSPWILVRAVGYMMPSLLGYSLPLGLLVAVLLVFGKLSAHNEITAMRASGISLWQVLAPVLAMALGTMLVCIPLNTYFGPLGKAAIRRLPQEIPLNNPLALLEPGIFNDIFPGYQIYFDRFEGNTAYGIIVYELDDRNSVISKIEAEKGIIRFDKPNLKIEIELLEAQIERADPNAPRDLTRTRAGIYAASWPIPLDLNELVAKQKKAPKRGEMTLHQLMSKTRAMRRRAESAPNSMDRDAIIKQLMPYLIEASKRLALAVAPVALVLVGMPLGIRTQRGETSIGIGLGILVALTYYAMMGFAEAFATRPHLRPELLVWIPNLFCEVLGILLLYRVARV